MRSRNTSRQYLLLIFLLSTSIVVVSYVFLFLSEINEGSLRILIRWTAKISATLFAFAFVASSLHYFFKRSTTARLLAIRPHLGLAFVTFHTFHLFLLIWLQNAIHPVFTLAKTSSLLGGGLAYLLMYLMALTTFPKFRKTLNPKTWRLLHLVGGYWIWLIFFRSYFRNVITKDQYYILFALFSLVLILRVSRLLHQKLSTSRDIPD